jgi:type IV secretion system protein VirD4
VLLSFPGRDRLGLLAAYGATALVLYIVLRRMRDDPPSPSLAGERWATHDALRAHQCETWPQPAPYVNAGTWWDVERRGAPRPIVYGVDACREGRHTLLVAPTGLGKGLWTTTQLLTWNGTAIVNDLKADTYPRTAGWRATLGPVYVLSASAPIHRFDPTAAARTEDDLRPLAFAVCYDPEDAGYWGQHAGRILLALMLAAKQSGQSVFPFLARAIRAGAARALGMLAEVDPALADRVRPYGHGGSGPFPSAWETLVTRCDSLLSPVTLATMSGTDVDPVALLRDRTTVYLQIPEARLSDLRPFLRLMWTSLLQQLTSASDRVGADHPPLLLILDEAGRTPFADLPDLLVTMRSRRISCAVLVQALSQLRAAYDKQASTILGNCAVHLYARSEDLATQEYLSERLGTAEELLGTESHTRGPHGASVTQSQLRRFRPLLTPQQVRRMPDHAVVAFLPACPPTALARMDWRDTHREPSLGLMEVTT